MRGGGTMLQFVETITIDAPPATVFEVITDLDRYAQWNPWIVDARGDAVEGGVLEATSRLGARRLKVRHRILTRRGDAEFRWCDLGWFTALAYGERARFLEPTRRGTAYRVELTITGIAWRLVKSMYGPDLAVGLAAETAALKERAEAVQRERRAGAPERARR